MSFTDATDSTNSGKTQDSLKILSAGERRVLLESFIATARPLPEATLPTLFEGQVARAPRAIAVVFEEESLHLRGAQRAGQPAGPSFDRAWRWARKPCGYRSGALNRHGSGLARCTQGWRGLPAPGLELSRSQASLHGGGRDSGSGAHQRGSASPAAGSNRVTRA